MQAKTKKKMRNSSGMWADVFRRLMRNKKAVVGMTVVILLILMALFAKQLAPYYYDDQNIMNQFQPPSAEHWLGTDELGRDILSRIIYGSRTSMELGFISVGIALILGTTLGAIAGYYGGIADTIIMRLMDVLLAIPRELLAIAICASLGTGIMNAMIAVGISTTPTFARLTRASILSIRGTEYVEAARSINAGDARIILRHVLPNSMGPLIVQATLGVAGAILTGATLSFIGLGAQPPTPEWGSMMSSGRAFIRDYPGLIVFPGLAVVIAVVSLNLFGDGLRDALDPRLRN